MRTIIYTSFAWRALKQAQLRNNGIEGRIMLKKSAMGIALTAASLTSLAQDPFLGNEEIEKNGIPMIARKFSGAMVGMEGVVTIHLIKLASGGYLYDSELQTPDAMEFNKKICEMQGDKQLSKGIRMVIGEDERNFPVSCEANEIPKQNSKSKSSSYYYPGDQWDYRPVVSLSYDPYPRAGSYSLVSASAGVDFSVARGGELALSVVARGIPGCYSNGFVMAGSIPVANLRVSVGCYMYPALAGTGGKAVIARASSEGGKFSAAEHGVIEIF